MRTFYRPRAVHIETGGHGATAAAVILVLISAGVAFVARHLAVIGEGLAVICCGLSVTAAAGVILLGRLLWRDRDITWHPGMTARTAPAIECRIAIAPAREIPAITVGNTRAGTLAASTSELAPVVQLRREAGQS